MEKTKLLKKGLSILLSVAMVVGLITITEPNEAEAATENLVANGEFDTTDNWSDVTEQEAFPIYDDTTISVFEAGFEASEGKNQIAPWNAYTESALDNTEYYGDNSTQSLKWDVSKAGTYLTFISFPMEKGKTYQVSYDWKVTNGGSTAYYCYFVPTAGGENKYASEIEWEAPSEWTTMEYSFTAEANADYYFQIEANAGTVHIDNVSIAEVTQKVEILKDMAFEAGFEAGEGTSKIQTEWLAGTMAEVVTDQYSGNNDSTQCLYWPAWTGETILEFQPFQVTAGETYTVSYDWKVEFEEIDTSAYYSYITTPSGQRYKMEEVWDAPSEWTTVEWSFTATATEQAIFYIEAQDGDVYVDNVEIYIGSEKPLFEITDGIGNCAGEEGDNNVLLMKEATKVSQAVSTVADGLYKYSFQVKNDATDTGFALNFKIGDAVVATPVSGAQEKSAEWTTVSGYFETTAVASEISFERTGNGTVYLDDVELVKLIKPEDHTTMTGGGTSIPENAINLYGEGDESSFTYGCGAHIPVGDKVSVADGVLRIEVDNSSNYVQLADLNVSKGKTYKLSFYVCISDATNLDFRGYATGVGTLNGDWTAPIFEDATALTDVTDGWTLVEYEWTAPSTGSAVFGLYNINSSNSSGLVFVDDIAAYDTSLPTAVIMTADAEDLSVRGCKKNGTNQLLVEFDTETKIPFVDGTNWFDSKTFKVFVDGVMHEAHFTVTDQTNLLQLYIDFSGEFNPEEIYEIIIPKARYSMQSNYLNLIDVPETLRLRQIHPVTANDGSTDVYTGWELVEYTGVDSYVYLDSLNAEYVEAHSFDESTRYVLTLATNLATPNQWEAYPNAITVIIDGKEYSATVEDFGDNTSFANMIHIFIQKEEGEVLGDFNSLKIEEGTECVRTSGNPYAFIFKSDFYLSKDENGNVITSKRLEDKCYEVTTAKPFLITATEGATVTVNGEAKASGDAIQVVTGDHTIRQIGKTSSSVQSVVYYQTGDVSTDGIISDVKDLVALKKLTAGKSTTANPKSASKASDVNGDGIYADSDDLSRMRKVLLGTAICSKKTQNGEMPIAIFNGPFTPSGEELEKLATRTNASVALKDYLVDDIYNLIKKCGINTIYTADDYEWEPENIVKGLELAEKYGLDMFVTDYTVIEQGESSTKTLAEQIGKYSQYDSYKGIFVADEPVGSEYGKGYDDTRLSIAEVTPASIKINSYANTAGYANLYPWNTGVAGVSSEQVAINQHKAYLKEYVDDCKPQMISYDYYIFSNSESAKDCPNYLAGMVSAREVAKSGNIPFWTFVQAGNKFGYTTDQAVGTITNPTAAELMWNVNTALAFGAQGIQYYAGIQSYSDGFVTDGSIDFTRNGLIGANGVPTNWYYHAQTANKQIAAVDDVLMNAENKGIIVKGDCLEGSATKFASSNTYISDVTTVGLESVTYSGTTYAAESGSNKESWLTKAHTYGAIIGCFDYDGKNAYYVVNGDTNAKSTVTLTFSTSQNVTKISSAGEETQSGKSISLELAAGSAVLVVVE